MKLLETLERATRFLDPDIALYTATGDSPTPAGVTVLFRLSTPALYLILIAFLGLLAFMVATGLVAQ